jgi:2-polyprenyl-6-methoxyphenol hydroxylase-like FAD-dependent oxidoreductase
MPVTGLDVAVVGSGTAGAAAALFLHRSGHRVTVYEAVADPQPVGAGIMLQPTGMHVLARLGLLDAVASRCATLTGLRCFARDGRPVLDLAYADLHRTLFSFGIHRGVLFEALYDAVRREGIEVRLGTPIERLGVEWLGGDGPRRACLDGDGEVLGTHDLVVVADGARSRLRDESLVRRNRFYPWGALWFIGHDTAGAHGGVLHQVVDGTRRMLGLLPSGLGPRGDTPLVSLFWSIHRDQIAEARERGLDAFKAQALHLCPQAEPILGQIGSFEDLLFAQYHDVVLSRWHLDGVVYLGDAAHAMSPQLGQGANLALYDASVLAECLAEADRLEHALAEYSRRRRHHLAFYQWATRWATPFFQSDRSWLGTVRDRFMGLACRVPYVRQRMIRTMCGMETGFVRRPLALPREPLALARDALPAESK